MKRIIISESQLYKLTEKIGIGLATPSAVPSSIGSEEIGIAPPTILDAEGNEEISKPLRDPMDGEDGFPDSSRPSGANSEPYFNGRGKKIAHY